ncbi:MAG: dUTP diphosphatase [Pseudomonadota bacterium]
MKALIRCAWEKGADSSFGLPQYETAGSAGADLRAQVPDGTITLAPGACELISTGLHMQIPDGYEGQIRPRSGLALKYSILLPNAPGTIDSDYRGVIGVILLNAGRRDFQIVHGMRIAQIVIAPVRQADFTVGETLETTPRGRGGFGSTGVGA